MEVFETFLDCGVLGEAVPAEVHLEYFPETDITSEYIEIDAVIVSLPLNNAVEGGCTDFEVLGFDPPSFHVLDSLTDAQKNNIEEIYLDQLDKREKKDD